ncbi:SMAD/FHA domain-containing protein isoform 2 [Carex littledalei]|uniref:SMAD/FHA domain-containing protein isoform 2 n=1 Tax=Carex littledalei TaxID=544730 RepID=A0A833R0H2_9POAL|nr:SMAD/FHA domain-containing protein isoform 2 [Carex littledalei]
MTTIGDGVGPSNAEVLVPAFAKLQGENFEYYMRKYSIMLGRNSKKKSVDLDLRDLGGGMGISRHHARIYYDFTFRCFALEVIGRKGCIIKNVLFMPGNPPIKLDSQDLLQIGEVRYSCEF